MPIYRLYIQYVHGMHEMHVYYYFFLCPSRKRSAEYLMFGRSSNIRPNVHFRHGAGLTPAIFGFHVRVTLIKFFLLLLEMPDFSLPCLPCNQ